MNPRRMCARWRFHPGFRLTVGFATLIPPWASPHTRFFEATVRIEDMTIQGPDKRSLDPSV
jgi:hypothetical protein